MTALLLFTGACSPDQPAPASSPATTRSTGVEARIGVVGCSVTLDALRGYRARGGSQFWPDELNYGLGTVSAWGSGEEKFWDQVEQSLNSQPETSRIWWQLCAGNEPDTLEHALATLQRLEGLAPDALILVSAQPKYEAGQVCPVAGQEGPQEMSDLAAELIANHGVEAGPDMGTLKTENLRDNCHADNAGREIQGQLLLEFFDG